MLLLLIIGERIIVKDVLIYDAVIVQALVVAYKTMPILSVIEKGLAFCGRHSMNIFLFHTFIYYYWFREFIYATRNPLLIFVTLFAICLILSVIIEKLKRFIRFDKFVSKIDSLYVRQ